mmetsp:Transcript_22056/g.55354  ORF Transcript_22056/g.55354 Transcript_22056/m.55354 type:complete len:282 (+) Transcript_22056:60-905(+)
MNRAASNKRTSDISSKFEKNVDAAEQQLKAQTVGLVSHEDFKRVWSQTVASAKEEEEAQAALAVPQPKKLKVQKSKLSFAEDEDEEEEVVTVPKKSLKDPTVNTAFLPDRERDEEEAKAREILKQQWLKEQEKIKQEKLDVTYSYWDGSGHRRTAVVTKGTTIGQFLYIVIQEFSRELRGVSVDNLLFIKEDLILPHQYSFYDLIATKARGKSGPLFNWDVHDDVRLTIDASKEKDESHAAKVVERRWYEKNKHIFPASRWEVFDPSIKRDKYTIHGDEVN